MARIRMLQAVAGPDFSWDAGMEIDLPGEEASKWADGIRAELVRGDTPQTPETAAPESTAAPTPRPTGSQRSTSDDTA